MALPGARGILSSLAAATLLTGLVVGSVAGQDAECEVAVTPASAVAGTEFTLSGAGYTPAELTLQKDGGEPVTVELDLPAGEPFEIPIASRPGDEGRWTATLTDPTTGCSASVGFRVTLLDTAAATPAGVALAPSAGGLPLVLYLLVLAAGFSGGVLLARRTQRV